MGVGLSCVAFWAAERADHRRVLGILESRAEWRARDLEAKIRLSGNAVENVAIALAANPSLGPDEFHRIATRARHELDHVNSLQWSVRVPREGIAAFEDFARALGIADYRVYDVDRDFRPTELTDRAEYFPVLHDLRFHGERHVLGLALGRFEGRARPMRKAQEEGRPIATLPVRPIGPPTPNLVYLLFWPVYDGIEVPATLEERRTRLRGYALANFNVGALLTEALRETSEIIETIHFSVAAAHREDAVENATAIYSPASRRVEIGAAKPVRDAVPAVRIARHFSVFDQHWDLTFDYATDEVAAFRSRGAWGWLAAGLLLTITLVVYLVRERGRTERIEALVAERTAALQRTSEQLHQVQKMEAIGNLTGGIAHDFNNLLAVVIGNLDLLRDRLKDDPRTAALVDAALQASTRGAELTRQLVAFARRQPLEPKRTDVNDLVSETMGLLERILEGNIEVRLDTAPAVWPVMIDPAQLSAAIANLVTNARDAMPQGGQLMIETRNTHLDADYAALNAGVVPGDFVLIEVSDTGTGMPPETLAQAFEPFFTTKEAGRGTGLGLSMVFGFVKQSHGHIKLYSEVGHGTTVRIYLPRVEREAVIAEVESPAVPHEGYETILVVEDDADVRDMVVRQLTTLGHTVIAAATPQAALALVKDPATQIDLLFTDLLMPGGMNGLELARLARVERPGLKVLFTSGYSAGTLRSGDKLTEVEHFLGKPYRRGDLSRKLQDIFGR
jgi:signal transduction histidine kinase